MASRLLEQLGNAAWKCGEHVCRCPLLAKSYWGKVHCRRSWGLAGKSISLRHGRLQCWCASGTLGSGFRIDLIVSSETTVQVVKLSLVVSFQSSESCLQVYIPAAGRAWHDRRGVKLVGSAQWYFDKSTPHAVADIRMPVLGA